MGDHKSTSRFTHKTAKQTHKQKKGWGRCGNIPFGSQKNKTTAPKQLALTLLFFALLLIKSPPEISGDPIVCEVQRLKSNKSSRGGGLTLSFAITCDRMMSVFITPVIEWS